MRRQQSTTMSKASRIFEEKTLAVIISAVQHSETDLFLFDVGCVSHISNTKSGSRFKRVQISNLIE